MLTLAAAQEAAFLLAQVTPTVPVVPAVPVDPNTVVIPYGAWLDAALSMVLPSVGLAAAWMFRWVPDRLRAIFMTMQVEQLLTRSIAFAINTTQNATRDKVLTVDVGNRVLREAIIYALMHGGTLVKSFMGTPTDIAEKIFSRMNVAENATRPDFEKIAGQAEDAALMATAKRVLEKPANLDNTTGAAN